MKRSLFALIVFIVLALSSGGPRLVGSGDTIPMWTYTVTSSRDGKTYTGTMVGASPFTNPNSTTVIPTQIVPVILKTSDGTILDPTAPDGSGMSALTVFQQSPIFENHVFTMNGVDVGTTQYLDAFQRANFWSVVGGQSYHTLLNATTLSAVTVNTAGHDLCGTFRGHCAGGWSVDGNWLNGVVKNTLIPSLAQQGLVNPTTFLFFLLPGVSVVGYHGAVGSPPQTYAMAPFYNDYSEVIGAAKEIGAWMNDPLGTNPTPSWGNIGLWKFGGCQAHIDVGEPFFTFQLAPPVTMPNGHTYFLPELAFFSWFMGAPSLGAGGLFSNNGTLRGDARLCPPAGTHPDVPGDLDGNAIADLVWRDTQTGDVWAWLMNHWLIKEGLDYLRGRLASSVPLAWQIVGVGDVNGDGLSDLVWRQTQTGDVAVWWAFIPDTLYVYLSMNPGSVVASAVPLAWQIVGVRDLDGDGKADLVWRHSQTGDVAVWLMDGATVKKGPVVASGVPLAWQIVGAGDLDGDGKADMVWRHTQTGDVAVWLMNGVTVKQGPVVAAGVPLAWQISGVGDLDGDGKADLVWRHAQTGDVAAWLMNGVTVKQGPVVASGVPLTWQIVKVGDVDGDGKADLVWRQTQTGDVAVWLMDGVTVKKGPVVASGVPLAWQIQ